MSNKRRAFNNEYIIRFAGTSRGGAGSLTFAEGVFEGVLENLLKTMRNSFKDAKLTLKTVKFNGPVKKEKK